MENMKRVTGRSIGFAALLVVLIGGRVGSAFQRNSQPPTTSNYPSSAGNTNSSNSLSGRMTSIDDQAALRQLEEKRGKALNTERQRAMVKDTNQMVQAAADLQVSVNKGIEGAGREEQAKRAEAIEKLAKDVKERMKGSR